MYKKKDKRIMKIYNKLETIVEELETANDGSNEIEILAVAMDLEFLNYKQQEKLNYLKEKRNDIDDCLALIDKVIRTLEKYIE